MKRGAAKSRKSTARRPGAGARKRPGARTRATKPRWTAAALMKRADHARRSAWAPYSRFPVGAALLATDGEIVEGCNVENSSFGLSICAERNAVFHAVAQGLRDFEAVAVTAAPGRGASPCGACRQVLFEFSPRMWVIWRDARGRLVKKRLERLLDSAFRFPRRSA